jgi:amino acid transporter
LDAVDDTDKRKSGQNDQHEGSHEPDDDRDPPVAAAMAMIRTIAIWINWIVLALFLVSMLVTSQLSAAGAVGLVPLLPFGTALASYHFRPRLPLVWLSLALNVLFCVVGLFGIVAVFLGMTDRPVVAVVAVLVLLMLPCAFNVRNMLRIRLRLKSNPG